MQSQEPVVNMSNPVKKKNQKKENSNREKEGKGRGNRDGTEVRGRHLWRTAMFHRF